DRAARAGAAGDPVRAPLTFAWGNVVFARDIDDVWALYRMGMESYAGLTASAKHETLERLAGFAHSIQADFQLLRVASAWSSRECARPAAASRGQHRHLDELATCRGVQEHVLAGDDPVRPAVFMAIRLASEPEDADGLWPRVSRGLGLRDARGISRRR